MTINPRKEQKHTDCRLHLSCNYHVARRERDKERPAHCAPPTDSVPQSRRRRGSAWYTVTDFHRRQGHKYTSKETDNYDHAKRSTPTYTVPVQASVTRHPLPPPQLPLPTHSAPVSCQHIHTPYIKLAMRLEVRFLCSPLFRQHSDDTCSSGVKQVRGTVCVDQV